MTSAHQYQPEDNKDDLLKGSNVSSTPQEEVNNSAELVIVRKELAFQNEERENRAAELIIANKELIFQNGEKENRASELVLANRELALQNIEKEKRAAELIVANKELIFQNEEKEKLAEELIVANRELAFQNSEKEKRAEELIILTIANTAERKKAEVYLAHLAAIVAFSDDAIISKSLEGEIRSWNKGAEKMFGYSATQAEGKNISLIIPANYLNEEKELLNKIQNNEKVLNYETIRSTKAGQQLNVSLTVSPMKDEAGNIIGISTIVRDITLSKKFKANLINANRELKKAEQFIHKNTVERELLIRELKRSIEDLKQFSYITSHNFRAPLSNLLGLLNLVDYGNLNETNNVILAMFKISTQQLNKTINDLVKILIIRNNVNVDIEDNNVSSLLDGACNSLSLNISEIACEIRRDLRVENIGFNKSYLESILLNLLSNAIKYRSPDRKLRIDISTELKSNGEVLMIIKDNGIGIDLFRHRDKVFGLYQRFHSNIDSVGLGLFMVKTQVIALGGHIEIESNLKTGTSFFITFKETDNRSLLKAG